MYPTPLFLNPQGDDRQKALLKLARGKKLDGVAAGWLAIHGANLYGYDKVSLEDRIQWIEEHEEQIVSVVDDPLDGSCATFWQEAEKPWQFLAFCIKWRGYLSDREDFVSHLPVALDGSCNGLQHYAAALRDEQGGAVVNLIPTEKPADIYQIVADRTVDLLRADSSTEAQRWLEWGIDRKTTKRPVMIVPYSGTLHSCRQYILEHMEGRIEAEERAGQRKCPFEDDELRAASSFMANKGVESDPFGDQGRSRGYEVASIRRPKGEQAGYPADVDFSGWVPCGPAIPRYEGFACSYKNWPIHYSIQAKDRDTDSRLIPPRPGHRTELHARE